MTKVNQDSGDPLETVVLRIYFGFQIISLSKHTHSTEKRAQHAFPAWRPEHSWVEFIKCWNLRVSKLQTRGATSTNYLYLLALKLASAAF